MRAILCVAALALLASAAVAVGDEPAGEVLVLNDDNFASIVPSHDVLLVEFYAPWCGHCKALEPKYNEAAKLLAASPETANIRIAKMDADSQKKVPGQFGVSGFPTIKLFRNGEVAGDYDGERTAEAIVEFMKKKAASAVNKEFTDGAALKKLLKNPSNPTLVALCSSKDHLDFKYYKQVVSKFADNGIDIYHAAAPSVLEAFGYYASGCLIQLVRPNAKPQKVTYQGTIFKDKLREWIVSNVVTPFAKYTPESQKLFTQLGKNLVRIVRDDKAAPVDVKALEPLAKTFEEKFFFTVSDLKDYQAEVDAHCSKGSKKCVLLQDPKGKVFGMDSSDITVATITEFIEAFNAKKLKVKVKSEATPAPPKAGEVAVIVGTTFESEVLESDKDVFIEFYAPWCGHCKALAPKYDQLASEMADQFDKVTIAKIDLTNNDLPADMKSVYEVSGFPTIYFAPKGKKNKPIKYEGQREVADLKKWVTEHLSS